MSSAHPSHRSGALVAVQSLVQFVGFLRDSKRSSGHARRLFVIAGADRLRYQVGWSIASCHIEHVDGEGAVLHSQTVALGDLLRHPLIEALHAGQLYTPPGHH